MNYEHFNSDKFSFKKKEFCLLNQFLTNILFLLKPWQPL